VGEGFTTPGQAERMVQLIASLGLRRKMKELDIEAGLGGTTRLIAERTEAWVTGLESEEMLVRMGMKRSISAGLIK